MDTFDKARKFIYRNARPLDLARFQYHFENGDKLAVINALKYYQNEDGGFGHAIEPDCFNPNSIPLHSGGAADIIREIDFNDNNHPMIVNLLNYFFSGKDFDGKHWYVTVASNNDFPHAPWWHTESVSRCHTDYNGTAQIAGFIVRYAKQGSDIFNFGLRIIREAIADLSPDKIEDMHTCACYVRMMEYIKKAEICDLVNYDELNSKLHRSVKKLIENDINKWGAYVCKPSSFFNTSKSEFYQENKYLANYECEFLIKTQLEDGSWDIPWRWDNYPEAWAISKNWWKSINIILNLLYLRGMGRLTDEI